MRDEGMHHGMERDREDVTPGIITSTGNNTCIDPLWTPLPQPVAHAYQYVTYEDLPKRFGDGFEKDQLVWVLTSKGRFQTHRCRARVGSKKHKRKKGIEDESKEYSTEIKKGTATGDTSNGNDDRSIRKELFMRARVVSITCNSDVDGNKGSSSSSNNEHADDDAEPRVLVRYPKGSTYNVRKSMLLPVLEPRLHKEKIVLVIPETNEYRRSCIVHTCVGETFLEIGCDFGPCTDRVRKALIEGGDVPLQQHRQDDADKMDTVKGHSCLGIDKNESSIEIAKERYPDSVFSVEDAITDRGVTKLRALCREKLNNGCPSVVAVDINGNRPLGGVLACLERVMCTSTKDADVLNDDWTLPRLIIVKSRELHEEVLRRKSNGLRC